MCSYAAFTRFASTIAAVLLLVSRVSADELLPEPLPVLRIGASAAAESEAVTARRVELAPETITENYPNRKPKIERQVVQDDERNYVNHGPWKMWDPDGRLIAHGEFRFGKQHGTWIRLMSAFGAVEEGFQPPFTSQAEFANGQLHGTWTVSDSRQRMVGSWEFDRGELHGKVTDWFPSGQPRQEMTFQQGKLDGEVSTFSRQGSLVNREFFRAGKQLIPVVTWHEPNQQKQAEGWAQTDEVVVHKTIDWWEGLLEISREPPAEEPVRIGQWTEWHDNGNTRFSGAFRVGMAVGVHTWWHDNGQKQLTGRYEDGQRVDRWTRWHANGRKQEEGEFSAGMRHGVWKVWAEDGELIDEQQVLPTPAGATEVVEELLPIFPVSNDP